MALAALVACALLARGPAVAAEADGAGEKTFSLRTSLKASLLVEHGPEAPLYYPEPTTATSYWRLRLEPEARLGTGATLAAAYEQRLRSWSAVTGAVAAGFIQSEAPAPYRVAQLDWSLARGTGFSWRHEIDRLAVALRSRRVDLTLGRQAVGWGRGVLFGAIDLYAPFTPLEPDREWRRGVDAARAEVKFKERYSLDAVAAFDDTLDGSAFGARLRGYRGKLDFEVCGGRRARDLYAGVTSSAALGDVEVHGELALFRLPEALPFGARNVPKAVLGGSYRLALGKGLMLAGEYHYSGFGAPRPEDIVPHRSDPGFRERYLRGDTQILGRHALAVIASYEVSPELALSNEWLQSPSDGSGVVVPSVTLTLGDKVSLLFTGYVPYGEGPVGLTWQSEYGLTPLSAFVQLRLYE